MLTDSCPRLLDLKLVSERTAKRVVAALLHKLDVTNRIAAAAMAGRFGLLDHGGETD